MKKILHNLLFFTLFTLLFLSCQNKETASYTQMGWTSSNPLSIPLKTRIQKLQLGNLIPNSSFEKGRFYSFDSTDLTFNLNDWKKVGENVNWVNTRVDSIYTKDEVSEGFHAIRITRNHANETDKQGSGVMSGFIKIIPGNYDFSFDIKLENIKSSTERLGTKIYDAVDIRIYYYDKNKILMSGENFCPPLDKKIDVTFKANSFSNFWEIDDFGWSRIIGHSYYYPYDEGDVPDDAKYIKVFLGLKGTGRMWVDNIDFRYSNKNFTALEQTISYFDSTYTPEKFITPTPQFVFPIDTISFAQQTQPSTYILIPKNSNTTVRNAANIIKTKLDNALRTMGNQPGALIVSSFSEINNDKNLIFSIGNTELFTDYKKEIPCDKIAGKMQGYIIKSISNKNNIVFLYAKADAGLYYGANTICQLISVEGAFYFDATIIDFPNYTDRSISVNNIDEDKLPNIVSFLYRNKINSLYYPSNDIKLGKRLTNSTFNQVGICINNEYDYSQNITQNISKILYVTNINKVGQNDTVLTEQNWESKAKECTHNLNSLKHNSNTVVTIAPLLSDNESIINYRYLSKYYFDYLNKRIAPPFNYAWCGKSAQCSSFDIADIALYNNITGTNPVFFDQSFNSPNIPDYKAKIYEYYPYKLRLSCLACPYKTKLPKSYYTITPSSEIILVSDLSSVLQQYRLATYADYCWNPEAYNPYFSLVKVLISDLGKEGTKNFLMFNDSYIGLLEICFMLEKQNGIVLKSNKIAEQYIVDLNIYYNACQKNFKENKKLLSELQLLKKNLIEKYHKLYEQHLVNKKLKEDSSKLISTIE